MMSVIFMFILLVLGVVLIDLVVAEYQVTHRDVNALRALAHAEAGTDLAMDVLCRQDITTDASPTSARDWLNNGWSFRGTVDRLFNSGTYTVTPASASPVSGAVDGADVVADADGGFQVVISEPSSGVVQVESWGFVNGNTRATAEQVYKATSRVRQTVQPLVDAVRARGTITFNGNGSGTQPVRITDTDGDGTAESNEMVLLGDPDAHARSLYGDIGGMSGRVRGVATVYGDLQTIDPLADGGRVWDETPPPAAMEVPGPDVMEGNRLTWLAATGVDPATADTAPFFTSGISGDTGFSFATGALTLGNNDEGTVRAPAYLSSISVGNGGTLRILAAADPARNVVYVGNQIPVNGAKNDSNKVSIGNGGKIQSAALLVVNGRMETFGQFLLEPSVVNSAVSDVAGLHKAALIVLGDDQNEGHPAVKLQSANQAAEATGMIYSAGSINMGGGGYVTGALMAYGSVTFSGSGCRVYFPVNMFPPPGFTTATMVAYHVARQQ
ncbi:MAG: hypothetical protein HY321_03850 [Armatimonadetes bacterium]|nr:hypothetical protein [Armatimonadota bacterium]